MSERDEREAGLLYFHIHEFFGSSGKNDDDDVIRVILKESTSPAPCVRGCRHGIQREFVCMCLRVCVYVCVCPSLLRCLKQYVFLPFRGEIVLFVLALNVGGGRIPHLSFLKIQGPEDE